MKFRNIITIQLVLCASVAGMCFVRADEQKDATPAQLEFFESKVRPLLHEKCQPCHNDKAQQGGVRLDSLAAMFKGNSGGSIITPGDVEKSSLIHVIRFDGKVKMPPSGKMKADEIAILTEWVKMGTPWTNVKVSEAAKAAGKNGEYVITDEQRKFWSFQPVKLPAVPKISAMKPAPTKKKKSGAKHVAYVQPNQPANPIDAFVLTKLQAKGLTLSPAADRRTLIRRVSFDLTGLPPTSEEVATYLNDKSPTAYEKVVDRLLASPRYGERWGRRWLDVARYADTKGYSFTSDANYHSAYNYRDYVIRSFNEDLPYNNFVVEQIAADCLELGEDRRPLAALGFLTLGRRFLGDYKLIGDDRIDVVTRGLMGLTVACARCHDHKFDPIPTADYYSLFGIFNSSHDESPIISPKAIREPYEAFLGKRDGLSNERDNTIRQQVSRLREIGAKDPNKNEKKIKDSLQSFRDNELPDPKNYAILSTAFEPAKLARIDEIKKTLEEMAKHEPQKPEFAESFKENKDPYNPYIFKRGNDGNAGAQVPRRFLAILSQGERQPYTQGSGRLELAQSIASPDNPLTGRVMVNRVWMYHFGQGLVRTPGDFGIRGEAPTHPELLDWLTYHFTHDDNWSVKKLHKRILMSQAYQQSSSENEKIALKDPENRLLYRQNRQRLDLESLRDSALYVAGTLDTTMGGPSVPITEDKYAKRRTVYGFVERQNLPGLFRTFDFASPDATSAQRFRTTVPQQALFMMNSPFLLDQARSLSDRKDVEKSPTDEGKIKAAYQLLFQREPGVDELALGKQFLKANAAVSTPNASPWQYGYGTYDEKSKNVTSFTAFPSFTGQAWQGGAQMPDPKLGYLSITADGGHPGHGETLCNIRRWVAPRDMHVNIGGGLAHPDEHGDGVRARVVSNKQGVVGEWIAFHSRTDTNVVDIAVKKGDILDFVVDCRTEESFDSFRWMVGISGYAAGLKTASNEPLHIWKSKEEFSGPVEATGRTGWERYIQALLMTNEFSFAD